MAAGSSLSTETNPLIALSASRNEQLTMYSPGVPEGPESDQARKMQKAAKIGLIYGILLLVAALAFGLRDSFSGNPEPNPTSSMVQISP